MLGITIILLSEKIVFPGLETVIGIETIVGADNIVYCEDSGYFFTNPAAMNRWILSIVFIGVVTTCSGIVLFIKLSKK